MILSPRPRFTRRARAHCWWRFGGMCIVAIGGEDTRCTISGPDRSRGTLATRRTLVGGALALGLGLGAAARAQERVEQWARPRLKFAVVGLNHGHIVAQCNALIRGGGALTRFHAREDDLAADFLRQFPWAVRVADEREILEDPAIAIIASAIVPDERAPL